MPKRQDNADLTSTRCDRRNFIGAAATTVALLSGSAAAQTPPPQAAPGSRGPRDLSPVTLTVNGRAHTVALDIRTTLLDALREHLGLTGAKKGCDHGQCGACTVHLNGRRVLACLTLAASAEGHAITTIEGLAQEDGTLHPMQQAFIDNDAFQCGFCTPGQIMSAVSCVHEGHAATDHDIREYMSGNLCRCAAYPNIVSAIAQARHEMRAASRGEDQ